MPVKEFFNRLLGDLADQAAQMAHVVGEGGKELSELATDLRGWEDSLRGLKEEEPMKPTQLKKWHEFSRKLCSRLDRYYGPFASIAEEDES